MLVNDLSLYLPVYERMHSDPEHLYTELSHNVWKTRCESKDRCSGDGGEAYLILLRMVGVTV